LPNLVHHQAPPSPAGTAAARPAGRLGTRPGAGTAAAAARAARAAAVARGGTSGSVSRVCKSRAANSAETAGMGVATHGTTHGVASIALSRGSCLAILPCIATDTPCLVRPGPPPQPAAGHHPPRIGWPGRWGAARPCSPGQSAPGCHRLAGGAGAGARGVCRGGASGSVSALSRCLQSAAGAAARRRPHASRRRARGGGGCAAVGGLY
jgi:hypothetical protein